MFDPIQTRPEGATTPEVVRARRFELVDDDGRVRGYWGTEDHGQESDRAAVFALCDATDRQGVGMMVDTDGPTFAMTDGDVARFLVAHGANGAVQLDLSDARKEEQVRFRVDADGGVSLGGWPGWVNETLRVLNGIVTTAGPVLTKLAPEEVIGGLRALAMEMAAEALDRGDGLGLAERVERAEHENRRLLAVAGRLVESVREHQDVLRCIAEVTSQRQEGAARGPRTTHDETGE